jgi:hypothetical protein
MVRVGVSTCPYPCHVDDLPQAAVALLAEGECECPQRYRRRNTRLPMGRAGQRGGALAEAVREWHARPAATAAELAAAHFESAFTPPESAWLGDLLRRYLTFAAAHPGAPLAEVPPDIAIGGVRFPARATVVLLLDGELEGRVVRTGRGRLTDAEATVLLAVLGPLSAEQGVIPIVREFHLLDRAVREWGEARVDLSQLAARHHAAEARHGPPVAGSWCRVCSYAVRCPALRDLWRAG